jgi:CPA2 family monovalent cation:H+ antiporter-2
MLLASADVSPMFSLLALMLVGVVAVSLVLLRLRQSLLVAYFLCGVAIANTGMLEAVAGERARETVATMSDYGVMLLLFVLGMGFSLGELKHLRRYATTGGTPQRHGAISGWTGRRSSWWRWLADSVPRRSV